MLIDTLILIPFILILEVLVPSYGISWATIVGAVLSHGIYALYFVIGHGLYGKTVGKKLLRLRVVDVETEQPISMRQSFFRDIVPIFFSVIVLIQEIVSPPTSTYVADSDFVFTSVDWILLSSLAWFFLDLIVCLLSPKRRAIHDLIGGTVVVRENVTL